MGSKAVANPRPRSSEGCPLNWGWFPSTSREPRSWQASSEESSPQLSAEEDSPLRTLLSSTHRGGRPHRGSRQITSLRGCGTPFKQLTLTVDSHWWGCEQPRRGSREGGGRRVVGAEREAEETPELQTQQERAVAVQFRARQPRCRTTASSPSRGSLRAPGRRCRRSLPRQCSARSSFLLLASLNSPDLFLRSLLVFLSPTCLYPPPTSSFFP